MGGSKGRRGRGAGRIGPDGTHGKRGDLLRAAGGRLLFTPKQAERIRAEVRDRMRAEEAEIAQRVAGDE